MSKNIYLHPEHRPGSIRWLEKLKLWAFPFTVWDKDGPKAFISRHRAMDFYYQKSRDLAISGIASISRSGWFKAHE